VIGIGTLIKLAIDGGWDPPWQGHNRQSGGDDDEPWKAARVAATISATGEHFAQDQGDKLYHYAAGVYTTGGEARIRRLTKHIVPAEQWSTHLADEAVEYIRADAPRLWERSPLDRVNLRNGILDVKSRVLCPHSPAYLSPIQLPIDYNPDALCPAWDAQLEATLPRDVYEAGVIWYLLAWLMLPITFIQKAVLLLGGGGTGKSTLLTAILGFLGGRKNVSSISLQRIESDRFSAARLLGKLANICADLPTTHLETSSTFKAITGGDEITGEFKFHDSFSFVPFARLLFSANHPPISRDASPAFFDRWIVIAMDQVFRGTAEEVDRATLDAKLAAPSELSGALNRALDALPAVLSSQIPITPSMSEAWQEFWAMTDPLARWLDENTLGNSLAFVPASDLMSRYNDDALAAGRPPLNKTAFGLAIRRLRPGVIFTRQQVACIRREGYRGIGFIARSGERDDRGGVVLMSFDIDSIPLEKIPALIAALSARLLMATPPAPTSPNRIGGAEPLLDAKQLAQHLGVHESKIRTEQRAGRIPCVTLGRWVRFKASEVERALKDLSKA
jgi:putative DNA primase/helicase